MAGIPYYYRESWGVGTNLQLHAMRQAWRLWQELKEKKDNLGESRIRERCVIIIALLGLSLSQLLGQNFSPSSKDRIPSLRDLWGDFLKKTELTDESIKHIDSRFQDFLNSYDACRHFGASKHERIDKLTYEAICGFVELSINIWDIILDHFKSKNNAAINFRSIRDILDENDDEEDEISPLMC